ncbi:uncharacterized protein YoxC [Sinobaca qinghaiensis]|uniref:Uncharacterized protein YoxC n=1 Tax=Sinobaca qinghaiensis TaxID=342944 RepID=A0A419UW29_9BACL|nr:DUF948 domain-containing protein [Sinobaca qinghaiensis]RKD68751.1 uncharacterized protein YoxC [Sinobaca qinghaiensis]
MEILLYISALIVAIAFAVLVIFIVQTLKAASSTMQNVAGTLDRVEKQVEGITTESEHLVQKSTLIVDDVQKKSQSLNGLFESLKDVGDSVQSINYTFKEMSDTVTTQSKHQSDQVARAMQWGNAAIDLYTRWQARQPHPESTAQNTNTTTGG